MRSIHEGRTDGPRPRRPRCARTRVRLVRTGERCEPGSRRLKLFPRRPFPRRLDGPQASGLDAEHRLDPCHARGPAEQAHRVALDQGRGVGQATLARPRRSTLFRPRVDVWRDFDDRPSLRSVAFEAPLEVAAGPDQEQRGGWATLNGGDHGACSNRSDREGRRSARAFVRLILPTQGPHIKLFSEFFRRRVQTKSNHGMAPGPAAVLRASREPWRTMVRESSKRVASAWTKPASAPSVRHSSSTVMGVLSASSIRR